MTIISTFAALALAALALPAVAQDCDAIVFHQTTNFAVDIAEALDIPVIMTAMQPLNEGECLMIEWSDIVEPRFTFGGFDRLDDGFHV